MPFLEVLCCTLITLTKIKIIVCKLQLCRVTAALDVSTLFLWLLSSWFLTKPWQLCCITAAPAAYAHLVATRYRKLVDTWGGSDTNSQRSSREGGGGGAPRLVPALPSLKLSRHQSMFFCWEYAIPAHTMHREIWSVTSLYFYFLGLSRLAQDYQDEGYDLQIKAMEASCGPTCPHGGCY